MNLEHEYVMFRLIPHIFEGNISTWYFSLTQGSINSWNDFETSFTKKFGDDPFPTVLVLKLSRIKIDSKKQVK
jgi:hypothetical protein